MAVVKGLH